MTIKNPSAAHLKTILIMKQGCKNKQDCDKTSKEWRFHRKFLLSIVRCCERERFLISKDIIWKTVKEQLFEIVSAFVTVM